MFCFESEPVLSHEKLYFKHLSTRQVIMNTTVTLATVLCTEIGEQLWSSS